MLSLLRRFAPPQLLLAASIPFVGYALAFMYERGYTGRYGVQMWMTQVTFMQTLIASVAAALLVAATPAIARTSSRVASQWILRIVLAPLAALAVALWAVTETQWVMGMHLLIPAALIAVFGGFALHRIYRTIVAPMLAPGGGSGMERLQRSAQGLGQPGPIPALAWMGHRVRWTAALLVVALFGAHWYGNHRSRNERSFLVASSAPACVAVRYNADGIICAITDVTRRRVLPQFRVLPPAAKEKLTLATLPALRSPLDADRKLFAPARAGGTTGTVYAGRNDANVTQAGRPMAKKPVAKKPTTKRPTATATRPAAKKPTATKKTATTRR